MVDPDTYFQSKFNTELTPEEEIAYQQWAKELSAKLGHDVANDTYDYDMRGAFKSGAGAAANGHFPDTFKKPNHPTFSTQSIYNGVPDDLNGGNWEAGAWVGNDYMPSKKMLQTGRSIEELQKYFSQVEPTSKILQPLP